VSDLGPEGGTEQPQDVPTFRMTVSYDGTDYHGFQVQAERRTIQGELEDALRRITRERVRIKGAGRTDAGVHAYGQVASFRCGWRHDPLDLERALNAVLPMDISVREVAYAEPGFHARFSATWRMYVHSVYRSDVRMPLLARYAQRVCGPLDVDAMQEAAQALEGEHDFAAFGRPTVGDCTRRRVRQARWVDGVGLPWGWCDVGVPVLQFHIEANGFLRGMVRRIVAALLEIGAGTRGASALGDLLASGDLSRAPAPAPACGLCLWQIRYD